MRFEAELDIADALDLNHALTQKAAEQKALGSAESLDVRRAKALGDLARTQTALDLLSPDGGRVAGDSAPGGRVAGDKQAGVSRPVLPAAREVVLHAHFSADSVGEQTVFGPTGRMEERQRLILLDQLKSWCGDSRTKITVKPVVDLNAHLTAPGYDIPDRIRDQVILRDRTCVFPWCTRPARGCDIDHVIAYDHDAAAEDRPQPGPTHTDNLACPLPVPPPTQDPHRLALPRHRTRRASSGPAPTATTTDATPPAPRPSSRQTEDDPAPHPAEPRSAGSQWSTRRVLERSTRLHSEQS